VEQQIPLDPTGASPASGAEGLNPAKLPVAHFWPMLLFLSGRAAWRRAGPS